MSRDNKILMGHGSGGTMMSSLLSDVMFKIYGDKYLERGDDAAVLDSLCLKEGEHLAYSTDSFVVTPQFFPGGDIGHLCVCGTVNDLATSGAKPYYLSVSMIIEEGYPIEQLISVCESIAATANEAGVEIVTGDTKVVEHGSADGLYINTSGLGVVPANVCVSGRNCKPGDVVIISGTLADHGMCIMSQRQGLQMSTEIASDAAPLNHLVADVLNVCPQAHAFRDPTRGGIASTLNEFAQSSNVDIVVHEDSIPIKPEVASLCDMLGLDPCHVANEGKMVIVVHSDCADTVLDALRANKYGKDACVIGEVLTCDSGKPRVNIVTQFGTTRILDMLSGQQLPRIC